MSCWRTCRVVEIDLIRYTLSGCIYRCRACRVIGPRPYQNLNHSPFSWTITGSWKCQVGSRETLGTIILPTQSQFTELLTQYTHFRTNVVLSAFRQRRERGPLSIIVKRAAYVLWTVRKLPHPLQITWSNNYLEGKTVSHFMENAVEYVRVNLSSMAFSNVLCTNIVMNLINNPKSLYRLTKANWRIVMKINITDKPRTQNNVPRK